MNIDFTGLIIAEESVLASTDSDRLKLNSLGDIYYDCSLSILAKSEELLNLATRNIQPQGDTAIDESFDLFLQEWMQQSVNVGFLDAYMQPKERQVYSRESSVTIAAIAPVEAIAAYAIEDIVAETLERTCPHLVAHEESVREWAECLLEIMNLWGCNSCAFEQLVKMSNLSPGRVFLALFLSEQFKLSQGNDFYGRLTIMIVSKSLDEPLL